MHVFVWKGKDPEGNLRCQEVKAENAQEAKAKLRAEGWSELQLVMNEPGEVELSRRRAQALAATGRLDEGLKEFSQSSTTRRFPVRAHRLAKLRKS
jgi:type II secretory pathway component PulF